MSTTISIEEAQQKLAEIIAQLGPEDEVVITQQDQPVAKLIHQQAVVGQPRKPGTLRGTVNYMAPDFDEPLEDFKEYM